MEIATFNHGHDGYGIIKIGHMSFEELSYPYETSDILFPGDLFIVDNFTFPTPVHKFSLDDIMKVYGKLSSDKETPSFKVKSRTYNKFLKIECNSDYVIYKRCWP